MLEATVEAMLTTIACIFFKEAIQTGKAPRFSKGKRKGEFLELLDWSFFQLLDVAKKAKWVPEELELDPSMDPRGIKTPVRIDTDMIRYELASRFRTSFTSWPTVCGIGSSQVNEKSWKNEKSG
jgi:hypothetical protein